MLRRRPAADTITGDQLNLRFRHGGGADPDHSRGKRLNFPVAI